MLLRDDLAGHACLVIYRTLRDVELVAARWIDVRAYLARLELNSFFHFLFCLYFSVSLPAPHHAALRGNAYRIPKKKPSNSHLPQFPQRFRANGLSCGCRPSAGCGNRTASPATPPARRASGTSSPSGNYRLRETPTDPLEAKGSTFGGQKVQPFGVKGSTFRGKRFNLL